MYSVINAFDPQEIVVIGFVEVNPDKDSMSILKIDVKERLENPLDEVIKPEISREFGILVSEDDFSAAEALEYRPATVRGKETDFKELIEGLAEGKKLISQAAAERDNAKRAAKRADQQSQYNNAFESWSVIRKQVVQFL
jgi:hypothetical protein